MREQIYLENKNSFSSLLKNVKNKSAAAICGAILMTAAGTAFTLPNLVQSEFGADTASAVYDYAPLQAESEDGEGVEMFGVQTASEKRTLVEGAEASEKLSFQIVKVMDEITTICADADIIISEAEAKAEELSKNTLENSSVEEISISQLSIPDDVSIDKDLKPVNYSGIVTGKACAYSAKPTALTASGRTVAVGHVAVDPKVIPYGTRLFITSTDGSLVYGYAIAADTGGALKDGRIVVDLFMSSVEECRQWGARQVNVYILD
ncbi:MAG: 3D domain-containing protein [Oscillospiraceae bacterium]|nr:3D domain-containing protein [Oscillospiraceae bacterium]